MSSLPAYWFVYLVVWVLTVIAGLVFVIPWLTRENWFSKLCPVGTLMGGLPWVTMNAGVRSMVRFSLLLIAAST